MSRTRVRWGRVAPLVAVFVAVVSLAGRAAGSSPERDGRSEQRHVVRAGDTLWEIARDLVGPEGDPRPVVAEIREENRLGTRPIRVSQVLILPA